VRARVRLPGLDHRRLRRTRLRERAEVRCGGQADAGHSARLRGVARRGEARPRGALRPRVARQRVARVDSTNGSRRAPRPTPSAPWCARSCPGRWRRRSASWRTPSGTWSKTRVRMHELQTRASEATAQADEVTREWARLAERTLALQREVIDGLNAATEDTDGNPSRGLGDGEAPDYRVDRPPLARMKYSAGRGGCGRAPHCPSGPRQGIRARRPVKIDSLLSGAVSLSGGAALPVC